MTDEIITIFLADDHDIVREGVASVLSKDPLFKIIGQCGHGLEVVKEVQKLKPDVVVLDISMPGMNGLDICKDLKHKMPATAVLIFSMHGEERMIALALERGASGYVLKEAPAIQLQEALKVVAKGGMYLGPGIPRSVLETIGHAEEDPYDKLSTRERQVFQLVAEGQTNREIAKTLGLAVKTVETHRARLMRKLNIHDRGDLIKLAIEKGFISVG